MSENTSVCSVCGFSFPTSSMVREHIFPKFLTGKTAKNSVVLVCGNCNAVMNMRPTEIEFTALVVYLMGKTPGYTDIVQESIFGQEERYIADIVATRVRNLKRTRLLIECKSSRFVSFDRINDVVNQLKKYKEAYGECQPVFAIPATLSESEAQALKGEGVELWDLDFLAKTFAKQLEDAPIGYFKNILLMRARRGSATTRASELSASLKACQPGKQDWSLYQSLVGNILEYLFCPTLTKPLSEHADGTKTNRRDFIIPNYAESGFWSFLRNRYMADYLVVDAKNYSRKIGKTEILQVANYLKPQGAGLVGMIFSRNGGDAAGCAHTLREQWLIHEKMILVFNDVEVESMLSAKEDGRVPEEMVEKKIEQFRLSI
ncbi:hypothetical protein P3T40_004576 [Paraburkholderia sp. EB58]|uniref:HNH endonuclease n=1 Tax=Paraburkholderia sp. EB58 TaxID=3035125 RepID=UPI003D1E1D75